MQVFYWTLALDISNQDNQDFKSLNSLTFHFLKKKSPNLFILKVGHQDFDIYFLYVQFVNMPFVFVAQIPNNGWLQICKVNVALIKNIQRYDFKNRSFYLLSTCKN